MHAKHDAERQEKQEWIEDLGLGEDAHCQRREGCMAPIDLSSHVDLLRGREVRIIEKHSILRRRDEGFCSCLRCVGTQDMGDPPCGKTGLGNPLQDPDLVSITPRMCENRGCRCGRTVGRVSLYQSTAGGNKGAVGLTD